MIERNKEDKLFVENWEDVEHVQRLLPYIPGAGVHQAIRLVGNLKNTTRTVERIRDIPNPRKAKLTKTILMSNDYNDGIIDIYCYSPKYSRPHDEE